MRGLFYFRMKYIGVVVLSFTDWHPKHFLDVAEMTTALALSYDWLYHDSGSNQQRDLSKTSPRPS